jgi:hypothetical protein
VRPNQAGADALLPVLRNARHRFVRGVRSLVGAVVEPLHRVRDGPLKKSICGVLGRRKILTYDPVRSGFPPPCGLAAGTF